MEDVQYGRSSQVYEVCLWRTQGRIGRTRPCTSVLRVQNGKLRRGPEADVSGKRALRRGAYKAPGGGSQQDQGVGGGR